MSITRFLAPLACVLCASAAMAQPLAETARAERVLDAFSEVCPIDDALGNPDLMSTHLSRWGNGDGNESELVVIRSHTQWPAEWPIQWNGDQLGVLLGRDAVLCGVLYAPIDDAEVRAAANGRFGILGEQRSDSLMPGYSYWADRSTSRQVDPAPHTVWTIERGSSLYEIVSYTPAGGVLDGRHVIWIRRPPGSD